MSPIKLEVGETVEIAGRTFVLLEAEIWHDRPSSLRFVETEYRRLSHGSEIIASWAETNHVSDANYFLEVMEKVGFGEEIEIQRRR